MEMILEMIKILIWPLFALAILLSFWSPLRRTVDMIPSIIGNSEAITIAGLSLKVGHSLRAKASAEVLDVLKAISSSGLDTLMEMSASQFWNKEDASDSRDAYRELVKLGLVQEVTKASLAELNRAESQSYAYGVRMTQLGDQTKSFLETVAKEFAQELAREAMQ